MKPIEELRAAHAATLREGWGAEWKVSTKYQQYAVTAEYAGVQTPVCRIESGFGLPKSNSAFIALAHNEFPALLDEIESLRRQLYAWDSVFGHLGDTPDAIGNLIHDEYDKRDAEIEALRRTVHQLHEENNRLADERDEARGN